MKKSNLSLNKLVARKDVFEGLSIFTALVIIATSITLFLYTFGTTYKVGDTLVCQLSESLRIEYVYPSYNFSVSEAESYTLLALAGAVTSLLQFSFAQRKDYCLALFSHAVKRKTVFLNRINIPIACFFTTITACMVGALAININKFGLSQKLILLFFEEYLSLLAVFIFSFTAGVFGSLLTGKRIEAIAGTLSLGLLPLAVGFLTVAVPTNFLYGYTPNYYTESFEYTIGKADPTRILLSQLGYGDWHEQYLVDAEIGCLPVFGVIFAVFWISVSVATLIFLRRYFAKSFKVEEIGAKGKNKFMVFVTSLTLPLGLAAYFTAYARTYHVVSPVKKLLIFTIIGTGIAMLSALGCNIIIHFSFKKLKTGLLAAVMVLCAVAVATVISLTGVFGTYYTPPATEDIEEVYLTIPFNEFLNDPDGSLFENQVASQWLNGIPVTDPKDIQTICDMQKTIAKSGPGTVAGAFEVRYTLKNGNTKYRSFNYLDEKCLDKLFSLWELNTVKEYYKTLLLPEENSSKDEYTHDVCEYTDAGANLTIISKHGVENAVLEKITEADYLTLRKAIYKDICETSGEKWFKPEKSQLGTLSFLIYIDEDYSSGCHFYISGDMKNTIKVLKDTGLYEYFEKGKEIKEIFTISTEDWFEYSLNNYPETHSPYFTYASSLSTASFFDYQPEYKDPPPIKEIKGSDEIKKVFDSCYNAYCVHNDGDLVFVKFADDTTIAYVIPNK